MKNSVKMLGCISIVLLIFVLMGQGGWLYQYREIKIKEFETSAKFVLTDVMHKYLGECWLDSAYHFKCSIKSDGKTFSWNNNKTLALSSVNMYYDIARLVLYDHLYLNDYLNIEAIKSSYQEALSLRNIDLDFVLLVRDSTGALVASSAEGKDLSEYQLVTSPISVGYECPHQITAAFREPSIYSMMMWHLVSQFLFLFAYTCCLYWQWIIMFSTWKNAKVQTMGIAHLEHELRKPLAIINSALQGILDKGVNGLTDTDFLKLKLIKVRMLKITEVTETMLVAVRDAVLTINRIPIDIHMEMEMVKEMFSALKSRVPLSITIQEGIQNPVLDPVYFNMLLINLIDNAIKYGGNDPQVMVDFSKKDDNFVLTVSDNGMGMSRSMIKHIFKQFYRGRDVCKISGFGLGLSFVDKVVKAYDGNITVKSMVGCGSTFIITLKDIKQNNLLL